MAIVNELITSLGFKLDPRAMEMINSVEKGLGRIAKMAEKMSKGFAVAKGVMDYFTGVAVKDAKTIRDNSKAFGISAEAYQRWGHAAKVAGVSADALYRDLKNLKDVKHLDDQGIIDWMNKLSSASPANALKILEDLQLSEDFLKLIKTQGGTGGVLKLLADAGPLLTDDEVENAAQYAENLNALVSHLDSMKKKALIQIAPEFNKQIEIIDKWLKENNYFIKEITAAGKSLSRGFAQFFKIMKDIWSYIKDKMRPIFGDWAKDMDKIQVAADAITAALLIMTGAKVITGLVKLTKIVGGIATFFGFGKGAAAGAAAGSAAGSAAGGAAAGGAAAGKLGVMTGIGGVLGGGWMIGEELSNLQTGKQRYNWLERMVKPLSEMIVGGELGEYRNTGNNQQKTNIITNNITVNPATPAAAETVAGRITEFITGNGNAAPAQ